LQRIKIVEVSGSPTLPPTFGHIVGYRIARSHHHVGRLLEEVQRVFPRRELPQPHPLTVDEPAHESPCCAVAPRPLAYLPDVAMRGCVVGRPLDVLQSYCGELAGGAVHAPPESEERGGLVIRVSNEAVDAGDRFARTRDRAKQTHSSLLVRPHTQAGVAVWMPERKAVIVRGM